MGKSVCRNCILSFACLFFEVKIIISLLYLQRGDKYRNATDGKDKGKKDEKDLNELKQELAMDEHQISLDELYARLGTNPDTGLTSEQAKYVECFCCKPEI